MEKKSILFFLFVACFFTGVWAQEKKLFGESVSVFTNSPDTVRFKPSSSFFLTDSATKKAYSLTPAVIGDFAEPLNVFGGYGWTYSDIRDKETNYRFLYLNLALGRLKSSAFGLAASVWQNSAHYRYYQSKLSEVAVAGFWQTYSDSLFGGRYNFFSEWNVGYKYVTDQGSENLYSRRQDDNMAYTSLTANWFKYKGVMRRIELNSFYQKSLSFFKEAYWDGKRIETDSWNRDYFEASLRVDVFTINLNKDTWRLSPKAIFIYDHEFQGHNNYLGWGVGLSLFKLFRLDWLSAAYTRKWDPATGQTMNRIGLEFDLHSTYRIVGSMFTKKEKKEK